MQNSRAKPGDGGSKHEGAADAVSTAPDAGIAASGRTDEGESGGGNYPNPHTDRTRPLPHGGQPRVKHYGGSGPASGDGKPSSNAPERPQGKDAPRPQRAPAPAADRAPHAVEAGGQRFVVVEESGVAAAEAAGAGQDTAREE